jgi:hypothetical protein
VVGGDETIYRHLFPPSFSFQSGKIERELDVICWNEKRQEREGEERTVGER